MTKESNNSYKKTAKDHVQIPRPNRLHCNNRSVISTTISLYLQCVNKLQKLGSTIITTIQLLDNLVKNRPKLQQIFSDMIKSNFVTVKWKRRWNKIVPILCNVNQQFESYIVWFHTIWPLFSKRTFSKNASQLIIQLNIYIFAGLTII